MLLPLSIFEWGWFVYVFYLAKLKEKNGIYELFFLFFNVYFECGRLRYDLCLYALMTINLVFI